MFQVLVHVHLCFVFFDVWQSPFCGYLCLNVAYQCITLDLFGYVWSYSRLSRFWLICIHVLNMFKIKSLLLLFFPPLLIITSLWRVWVIVVFVLTLCLFVFICVHLLILLFSIFENQVVVDCLWNCVYKYTMFHTFYDSWHFWYLLIELHWFWLMRYDYW